MGIEQDVVSQGSHLLPTAAIAGPALGAGLIGLKCFQIIPKGHVGIRTRFKNPSYIEQTGDNEAEVEANLRNMVTPGRWPRLHWPLAHSIELISVQNRASDIATVVDGGLGKKEQRQVRSQVHWRVKPDQVSVYRALYRPKGDEKGKPQEDNLIQLVEGELTDGFRYVMSELPKEYRTQPLVELAMKAVCEPGMDRYGTEIREVKLQEDARSLGQLVLESSLGSDADISPGGLAAISEFIPELKARVVGS